MTNDQIYTQGWRSAIKQLGTIADLCPFHYSIPQFKLWERGYHNGLRELKSRLAEDEKRGKPT